MRLRSTLLCACLAACFPPVHAADPLIPVDAFVEERLYSQPRLSPDGKHIAVNVRMQRNGRTIPTMTVYSLPDLQVVSTIALPGYEIPADFAWLTNQRLIVEKGIELGLRERPQATGEVVALDLDGSHQAYLYGYKNFKQSTKGERYGDDHGWGNVEHIPRSRDGHLFLGTHDWEGQRSMLYDINSGNAARKLLADIKIKDMGFLFQNDATPRFSYGVDDNNDSVLFRQDAAGEWRAVDAKLLGRAFHPFGFTPDDSAVYAFASAHGEPYAIVREDMKSGKRTVIAQEQSGSVDGLQFSGRGVPFAYAGGTGIPKARYLDDSAPAALLHKTLSGSFPDGYVSFINFTDDGDKLLFSVNSDRDPGSYYIYDKKSAKATLLFSNMPAIDAEQMAERMPISFAARDGLRIDGYLTMPKNPGKNKLPMVLLPHGGPFDVTDDWFFDDDAQFLASRGYAVLQVNFRGSGGRGVTFMEAGYREYGGKMMNDLIDGVKWANARADIDAARVCVYGASFGGYAALMLPVREPTMFKCTVGYSGRYDLAARYDEAAFKGKTRATNYLIKTVGNDPAMLAASSPTMLADQIKIPVLLVHGSKDKTTELPQAEKMRDALIKAGHPAEWVLEKYEDHGFYDSEHRKQFYQRLEAFLAKYIGPK